jgi:hypothetical protein
VLVAVGADRWLRVWDALEGRLLLGIKTTHRIAESIVSLACRPDNRYIATGDSGGWIKVALPGPTRSRPTSRCESGMSLLSVEGAADSALCCTTLWQVWDISKLSGERVSEGMGGIAVREHACWHAHKVRPSVV